MSISFRHDLHSSSSLPFKNIKKSSPEYINIHIYPSLLPLSLFLFYSLTRPTTEFSHFSLFMIPPQSF